MSTPQQNAIAHAQAAANRVAGVTVRYRRGETYFDQDVPAIPSSQRGEATGPDGFTFKVQSFDFLILSADLVINGEAVPPEDGDYIEETIGDTVYIYQVLPPSISMPAWYYRDNAKSQVRVHVKLKDESEVAP